jgi:hypothetical protein
MQLNIIKQLVFVINEIYVLSEVRSDLMHIMQMKASLQGMN